MRPPVRRRGAGPTSIPGTTCQQRQQTTERDDSDHRSQRRRHQHCRRRRRIIPRAKNRAQQIHPRETLPAFERPAQPIRQ